jgi:hypothetical protein
MCGGSQHSWQRTHIELLRAEVENLRSQLSARDAEVRALRGFAKDHWHNCKWPDDPMMKRHGLLDDDGNPTLLLSGEPGPGGEHE